jgi:hypothetical protein
MLTDRLRVVNMAVGHPAASRYAITKGYRPIPR